MVEQFILSDKIFAPSENKKKYFQIENKRKGVTLKRCIVDLICQR